MSSRWSKLKIYAERIMELDFFDGVIVKESHIVSPLFIYSNLRALRWEIIRGFGTLRNAFLEMALCAFMIFTYT